MRALTSFFLTCGGLLILALVVGALLGGCADHDNPVGPRRAPHLHFPNCQKSCTAVRPGQQHERR